MFMKIPDEVKYIIETLQADGYAAYIVGGCVRDNILGKEPKDWDICTSALPEQISKSFKSHHIIETGLRHGTVTLMLEHKPFEITTFRIDGRYSDNRRPDGVKFVRDLKTDLSRRDFTVNAIAYSPNGGIVDFFGGINDLKKGVIRCVGDPAQRFREDALRILRAFRFASVLSFSIDGDTAKAMLENRVRIKNIAAERVANEINKMITGGKAGILMSEFFPIIAEIIPELIPTVGFGQERDYDLLSHILTGVDNAPKEVVIRLAVLFHDIAKPVCRAESNSAEHFCKHSQLSADIAKNILLRLKYDTAAIKQITELILYHDTNIPSDKKTVKRWLNKIGECGFRQLIQVKIAVAITESGSRQPEALDSLKKISALTDEIIEQQECFSLKDLAVSGEDFLAAGVKEGAEIGKLLNRLVDMVINEELENDKNELLKAVLPL